MDIAVLSDIHGNYIALEACITYALERNIHTFIFLGDYLGEFAYPQRTMKLIYDLKKRYDCYFIKGNKEDYWLNYRASGERGWKEYDSTTGCLTYVYQSMTKRDFDFFSSLDITKEVRIPTYVPITVCHGSPFQVKQKLLQDDEKTYEVIKNCPTDIIICGHTHIQQKFTYNETTVLNPGSIGLPFHGGAFAQFMILHAASEKITEEFITLNYDVDRVIRELDEEKLHVRAPYWTKITKAMLQGMDIDHGIVLDKAMELCWKGTGFCEWPNIPEQYWEEAWKKSSIG